MKIDTSNWTKDEQIDYYKATSLLIYNNTLISLFFFGLILWFLNARVYSLILIVISAVLMAINYKYRNDKVFETIKIKLPAKKDRFWFELKFKITSIILGVICLIILISSYIV